MNLTLESDEFYNVCVKDKRIVSIMSDYKEAKIDYKEVRIRMHRIVVDIVGALIISDEEEL